MGRACRIRKKTEQNAKQSGSSHAHEALRGLWLAAILSVPLSSCATFHSSTTPELDSSGGPGSWVGNDESTARALEGPARKISSMGPTDPKSLAIHHFSLAGAYAAEGNTDRAIEEYKLVLIHDPKSSLVHTRLANEYLKKGLLSLAMESSKAALEVDPQNLDSRLMLAGLYVSLRDVDLAGQEYDRILKMDPAHEEALIYRAQLYLDVDQIDKAEKLIQSFVKREKDSAIAWYYLGRVQQKAEKMTAAIKSYRKAMDLKPSFSQAGMTLGFLYEETGKADLARKVYQEVYDANQDLGAASRLAVLLIKNEKYQEAIPYLEAIESQDPDDLNVRVKLGLIYTELKRFAQAAAVFEALLARTPDSDRVQYYLGNVYEEMGRLDDAIRVSSAVPIDSKVYGDSVIHAAYLLKKLQRSEDARELVKTSLAKAPRTPGLYLFLSALEEDASQIGEAIRALEKGVELFPEDDKMRYYLGSLYDRKGEVDKSLEQMERVLAINPDHVDALNYMGYTWTVRGTRLDDAERLLKRAMVLRPNNGYIQDSWGWHLYVRGRTREAIIQLEQAVRLSPQEATILEHLADAYLRFNLREKAARKYQEAVQVVADEDGRKKLEQKLELLKMEIANKPVSAPSRAPASAVGD